MSYQSDHMAWQQRISSEMNAHRRYFFFSSYSMSRYFDKILVQN